MKKDAVVYLNTRKKGDFEVQKSEIENYSKYRFNITGIYHDHRTSATPPQKRKAFQEMLDYCKRVDCRDIIIYKITDLAKDMDQGVETLKQLNDSKYTIYCADNDIFGFRDDPELRREVIGNFIVFMEQYRESAQKVVPSAAKKIQSEGKRAIGRPKALNDGQIEALLTIRQSGTSISQICRMFDVSRSTVSKILADHPELKGEWKGSRQETGSPDRHA
jgi:DNA invertase Pin-like site-specific DNA recombinase